MCKFCVRFLKRFEKFRREWFVCLYTFSRSSRGQKLKFETNVGEEFRNRGFAYFVSVPQCVCFGERFDKFEKNKIVGATHVVGIINKC